MHVTFNVFILSLAQHVFRSNPSARVREKILFMIWLLLWKWGQHSLGWDFYPEQRNLKKSHHNLQGQQWFYSYFKHWKAFITFPQPQVCIMRPVCLHSTEIKISPCSLLEAGGSDNGMSGTYYGLRVIWENQNFGTASGKPPVYLPFKV